MKITQNSVIAAISTCAIGVFSVLVWMLVIPSELSKSANSPIDSPAVINLNSQETPAPTFKEEIEIKFEGLKGVPIQFSGNYENINRKAKFKVTNRLKEWIYYQGYSSEDNCNYALYKDGNKLDAPSCWCGTGLGERTLWSKDSQTFEVSVPNNSEGGFQVKFDFKVGKKRRSETISVDFDIPAKQK